MREYRCKPLPSEMNIPNMTDPSIIKVTESAHAVIR